MTRLGRWVTELHHGNSPGEGPNSDYAYFAFPHLGMVLWITSVAPRR
ncbi:MAG: hypothetical protein QOJ93_2491, partial [Actinomycetota bacterium]|nr:hypothetical protein [Actinomycetota bacterium]